MSSVVLIGTGAAGNKGVLYCTDNGFDKKKALLINSTDKDIPGDCGVKTYIFEDSIGGCGKETSLAVNMTRTAIRGSKLPQIIEEVVNPEEDDQVIIIAGTEGGTGCGSAPLLADFIFDVFEIPVTVIGFNGFEADVRGLANTVEFYKKMKPDFVVQSICNSKFYDTSMSKSKAEERANAELLLRVEALTGKGLVDSKQNIDPTDLYKVTTSPGYTQIYKGSLDGIKNIEQFNQLLIKLFDENKSMDKNRKSTKLGYVAIMINAPQETIDSLDEQYTVIKERFGQWYELYEHKQSEEDQDNTITIILQGLDMPSDEISNIYKKYKTLSDAVDKTEDSFFSDNRQLVGNEEDNRFNRGIRKRGGRRSSSLEDKKAAFDDKYNNTKDDPYKEEKDNFIKKI